MASRFCWRNKDEKRCCERCCSIISSLLSQSLLTTVALQETTGMLVLLTTLLGVAALDMMLLPPLLAAGVFRYRLSIEWSRTETFCLTLSRSNIWTQVLRCLSHSRNRPPR